MQPQELLEQLHDINDLNQISFWPIGIGWWIIIGIISFIIITVIIWRIKWCFYKKTWKYQALLELNELQSKNNIYYKTHLNHFSNLLRKIAVHKFKRKDCAYLTGDKWLLWLTSVDPKHYNWSRHKDLLINMPYSETIQTIDKNEFKSMCKALRKWIK